MRAALTDIVQALASGQLDARTAGKMLYAMQQATSANRRIEKLEAAAAAKAPDRANQNPRIQEYPGFEKQFDISPGADIDAETDAVLRQADQEAELRQSESLPTPPPGVRPGSAAFRVYREEAYQSLRLQLKETQHLLRDYNEQKRQQFEKMKKEMMSATPAPEPLADSA